MKKKTKKILIILGIIVVIAIIGYYLYQGNLPATQQVVISDFPTPSSIGGGSCTVCGK